MKSPARCALSLLLTLALVLAPAARAEGEAAPLGGRPLDHAAALAATLATGVRIRWSKALSEALAPSPMAMTICL